MPISDEEWTAGETDDESRLDGVHPGTAEGHGYSGDLGTEKDLIVAFLSDNADAAFTRNEIVRGVDLGDDEDRPEPSPARRRHFLSVLREARTTAFDVLGDVTASAIVVDDVDAALDELVEEGMVAEREIETGDGTETHYRLAGQ